MANADGSMRVLASMSKKKSKKNTHDSRTCVTSLQVGMASGSQGPSVFLAKSRCCQAIALLVFKRPCVHQLA